ncbi:unnamed protein product [Ectocarpus sp. CCAP 1310/34]|nr:unnamed protein product [Ectocarpus sp. CCAP 1310/34]
MANRTLQDMSAVLSKHYLGEFKMRLCNITCTEMVRPLSQNGLQHLERSIQEVGWIESFAPSVVIQRDHLGDSRELTAEAALTAPAHTLDGNHRVTTLKKMYGESGVFLVRVYLEFNQADERLIANALNDATESVVQPTLYDKVYFQHELEEAIKREMKKDKVTQADIRRMFKFMNKKLPGAKDYADIDKNAGIAASFVENVLKLVPRDDWTPELRRLSHEKPNQLALYVKPHHKQQVDEAKRLLEEVSTADKASSHVVQLKESISTVVPSMPLPRIRNVSVTSYICTECSITHMGACANATFVTEEIAKERRCIKCPRSLDGNEGAGEAEDKARDVGKGKEKGKGKGKVKGKGKGKEASRGRVRPSLLGGPSGNEAVLMDKCRDENATLHDTVPLDPTGSDVDKLSFRNAPKLVIVSIGAEQRLLKTSEATNTHLRRVIDNVRGRMHPDGTIALVVPHPWSAHFHRLQGDSTFLSEQKDVV